MSREVRIIPAVLSAAIVLFGFGYVAVGRGDLPDASARIEAAPASGELMRTAEVTEVHVRTPSARQPLSIRSQS